MTEQNRPSDGAGSARGETKRCEPRKANATDTKGYVVEHIFLDPPPNSPFICDFDIADFALPDDDRWPADVRLGESGNEKRTFVVSSSGSSWVVDDVEAAVVVVSCVNDSGCCCCCCRRRRCCRSIVTTAGSDDPVEAIDVGDGVRGEQSPASFPSPFPTVPLLCLVCATRSPLS